MMINNQVNKNNTVYQYNITANSNVNYTNIPKISYSSNTQKPSAQKQQLDSALRRADISLRLVNPFKGV